MYKNFKNPTMTPIKKDKYYSRMIYYIFVICIFPYVLLDKHMLIVRAEDEISTEHIEKLCIEKCPVQNRTNSEHTDCGQDCYITQCTLGCKLWEAALDSSCKQVCTKNEQEEPNELYCVMGCNNALNRYFNWLIDEVGTPSAPALVADSLTATSLYLEWEIPPRLNQFTKGRPHIRKSYLVQWRYEEMVGDWKFCRNHSMGDNSTVRVDNLQPYTKYRFRVALILSPNHEKELFSEQSVIISTLPMGIPLSEPAIVRAVAVDHTRISISWEPGPFPNGPILSYVLQIKDLTPDGYFALKDIPASESFCLVEKLMPNTEYNVSITMRNAVGEGPAALTMVRTSSAPPIKSDDPKITLILGAEYSVLSQGIDLSSDTAQIIYSSEKRIMGIAIHIAKKLLFVSDAAGYVYKAPLEVVSDKKEIILTPENNVNFSPLALSVDWLNDHLYILVQVQDAYGLQWQISRCDLNGSRLTVAIAGLRKQPSHIEVDPYNGYLFWVINDKSSDSGLFRLDLGDISNGVKHEVVPFSMLSGSDLGAFSIDYIRFKILVPIQDNNTMISMDLDGKKREDIRKNTQSPKLQIVKSLAVANQIFYWTNGKDVLNEEYHTIEKNYYHNAYPDLSKRTFSFVRINHTSAQPIPVPVNPPSNVQALLSVRKGIVSWHVPHLLGIQGKSAWQEWNYVLEITDENDKNSTFTFGSIKGTQHPVDKLKPNTNYKFRAAAYTSAGRSPWSTEFLTRTLKSPHDRYLIWSSNEGLLQSDVLGEHIHQLIPRTQIENQNISDIAWFEDMVYFVSNFKLRFYNRTSGDSGQLQSIDSVQSIAVDWIGRRLYWFNTLTQFITRSNLHGYEQEPLVSIQISARDLKIDSLHGHIYFSTGHTVESCRLNGKHKKEYFRVEVYSGKQVMGLTLDMDNKRIYWIVRSFDGSNLISASMADSDHLHLEIYELQDKTLQGPLTYFSDRLLWLQDEHTVIIGNMTGKNLAQIKNAKLSGLKAFSVIDPTHHALPEIDGEINVIPEPINASSIEISGTWKSFDITWDPVHNVTFGEVFYECRFMGQIIETTQPSVSYYNESLQPYMPMQVTVRAFTYWSTSKSSKVNLNTPASLPSAPTNQRIFITHRHNPLGNGLNIEATFRWNEPSKPNGPIRGYKVFCGYIEDGIENVVCDESDIEYSYEKILENLVQNVTYFFQVQAYSTIGFGDATTPLEIHTKIDKPVPAILVASAEEILKVDLDLKKSYMVVNTGSPVMHITYIDHEKRLFWINENNELISYTGSNKTKLVSISSLVLSLAIDWVERIIYWSQVNNIGASGSSIYSLDLNKFEGERSPPIIIVQRPGFIYSLLMSPFDRKLLWVETKNISAKDGSLITYKLDTATTEAFFSDTQTPIHRTIALDTSSTTEPNIIWSDMNSQLFSTGLRRKHRIPVGIVYTDSMKNLAKDSGRIYWTKNNTLFAVNTNDLYKYEMEINHLQQILAFFHQNYPNKQCLLPPQSNKGRDYVATLIEQRERSLVLRLPKPVANEKCDLKLVGLKYTILYKAVGNKTTSVKCTFETCQVIKSYDQIKEIRNLRPFVKYQFQVSVNNYYGERMRAQAMLGPVVMFSTATGAPSVPRNISAEAVSPNDAIVQWFKPIEFNADKVWYEVHWQTTYATNGVTNRQQQIVVAPSDQSLITMNMTRLLPSQPYSIWVRAYTRNNTFNESGPVTIETLAEPEDITIIETTPYSLHIHWKSHSNFSKYLIEYQVVGGSVGGNDRVVVLDSNNDTRSSSDRENFTVDNLQPKTSYRFSVILYYNRRYIPYTWPQDGRFTFETLGDRPTAPGQPIIRHVSGDVFKVSWDASKENGAAIEEYSLEALQWQISNRVVRSTDGFETIPLGDTLNYTTMMNNIPLMVEEGEAPAEKWKVYYNGTDTYWIIKDLQPITQYSFRVKARNAYGWGPYSTTSEPINQPFITNSRRDYIIVAIMVPILVTLFVILAGCILFAFYRRVPDKKLLHEASTRIPDVELANLREMPRGGNFVHNNLLYSHGPLTDADIALLPQIRRDQITMTSFLGSGAFGEVYEGVVNDVDEADTRVAIKTLRKGATEQEKGEFLQEAQLMSNFKHEHILRLIGVCFDMDALYIIMELMQGGDLLSFLRQSRPIVGYASTLSLLDLVSMCVDIASGCRYLEEMHFVHRDLACRNCLVSSVDPIGRVVKIGDFGLARDIYKNDYYRKDGEGLLPVRWMSPESLVDGVFTSQSDIWAFGVLCWEIMTLGQQPYPARNNVEVLHYVRDGGRLGRPIDCPDELYQLMLKCWSYRPEERPTFRYCLDVLLDLQENTNAAIQIVSSTNRQQNDGIFNRSYLLPAENHNHCHNRGSLKFSCNGHDRVEPPPIVTPTSSTASPHTPKYLELLYDENDDMLNPISIISDGYEIPIPDSMIPSSFGVNGIQQHFNATSGDCMAGVDHINCNSPTTTEKERTFSSSSTVSEQSIVPINNSSSNCTNNCSKNGNIEMNMNQILKVALPNSKEDCSSNEALLLTMQSHQMVPNSGGHHPCKIRPFYTNAKAEEVINCDGKTMM